MRRTLLLGLILLGFQSSGQNLKEIIVDENDNGKVFSTFLNDLEKKHNVDFVFNEADLEAFTVAGIEERTRLVEYIEKYLVNFSTTLVQSNVLFILKKDEAISQRKDDFFIFPMPPGKTTTLSGKLTDAGNGEPLIGAQLFVEELNEGVLTDVEGNFSIQVEPGIYHLELKYVGYEPYYYVIGFSRYGNARFINASLFPESRELESVIVTAERLDVNVTGELTGVEKLNIETIKSMPTFMGEVDPVRSLTTLPGVSTAGELSSGFNVRGGESGQNLILQDGAPIYNPSHLFGFFSAFHPDMVSDVVLYKGGGPANFGGRVASVLNIDLKNGDAGKHTLSGGVGLVASRLAVEGPLVRGKSSYLLGGRVSYSNWLVNSTNNLQLENSSANFYDITGKIFHTINERNYITFSGYNSYDDFKLATDSTFRWGTRNFAFHWDHTFTDALSSTLTLVNSHYFSEVQSEDQIEAFTYQNAISTSSLKYDLRLRKTEQATFSGGIEVNYIQLEPGKLTPTDPEGNVVAEDMGDQKEIESAIYLQSDFKLGEKWGASAGLRYSHFFRLGPDNIYAFDYSDLQGRYPAIVDTTAYGSGDLIQQYNGFEPRISLRYLLNASASLKASYYRTYQYLHLISNTTSTTPQDYWVASGPYLKPEIGDQYSLGVFKNFRDNRYEVSVEGFYKTISNAVDYIDGADITLNPALEAGLTQGKGMAYGVELLLRKNTGGKTNGWLSYTFSRSLRSFDSGNDFGQINNGDYYPSSFDKPHNLSLVLNHYLADRIVLSVNFNYSTGRPITIPVSKFSYDAYLAVLNYSQRNEYRIPDYHRLDLSVTFKDRPRKNKRWMGEWVFSVFNVYGRENAYQIFFSRYGTANKLSVLGTMFPSFTYNFKF